MEKIRASLTQEQGKLKVQKVLDTLIGAANRLAAAEQHLETLSQQIKDAARLHHELHLLMHRYGHFFA